MSTRKMILAGFGGQGVILIGQMIAYAAMYEDKQVTFMPSYGPEMRGGTANCTVVVSDDPIACPLVDSITDLVAMNYPSMLKFESMVVPGGNIFVNASLIDGEPDRRDVNVCKVHAAELAEELGNAKAANMVMLGAIIAQTKIATPATVERVMADKVFTGAKAKLLPLNRPALTIWAEKTKA